jgi:hypothetical protein
MARIASRPFFLGGSNRLFGGKGATYEYLLEEKDCDIGKWSDDDVIHMSSFGLWTRRHAALVRQYKVNSASFHTYSFGRRKSADFLLELPTLRKVIISLNSFKDLSVLGSLAQLRSLYIDLIGWRLGDAFPPVDLSGLDNLEHVDVSMCRAFESVLGCKGIKELAIHNDCDGRLRDLDLMRLSALRDLVLDHCPKLRGVAFHPRARVSALKLTCCGSYKIDWPRMGPGLRYLVLGGRLTFPLEEIFAAPQLGDLHTLEIRKLPVLGFLRKLKHLRTVFLFAAPPGPKSVRLG